MRNSLEEDREGTEAGKRGKEEWKDASVRSFQSLETPSFRKALWNSHGVLDGRREGLTTDDSNERSGELNDVGLDSSFRRSKDEVSNSSSGGFSLLVGSEA